MDSFLEESVAELDSESGDCGCGGKSTFSVSSDLSLPSLEELNSALNEAGGVADTDIDDALLAELDLEGDDMEDPFQDLCDPAAGTNLQDLVELAERNPGLKITLSF